MSIQYAKHRCLGHALGALYRATASSFLTTSRQGETQYLERFLFAFLPKRKYIASDAISNIGSQ
jgi:hypothetical protein